MSNSTTVTCPSVTIANQSNPSFGHTAWKYGSVFANEGPTLNTFTNQWIWQVGFDAYQSEVPAGQNSIVFQTVAEQTDLTGELAVGLGSAVPIPFGNTFKLQYPVITKVSPTCVNAGDIFNIFGSGMYPSLVSSVLIGGVQLDSAQYKVNSDTNIQVVAPPQKGNDQSVVVGTDVGTSNTNVGIKISTTHQCP